MAERAKIVDGRMNDVTEQRVEMIPIEQIRVLNPRFRNKKKFQLIVNNIRNLGLKRPITVSAAETEEGNATTWSAARGDWRPMSPWDRKRSRRSSSTSPRKTAS
jgi:hypothetical protein